MTLNQLRYFCTASRCHSITKAAEELYVTQPTVSVAIRDLEIEFGISLFYRKGNQLILTQEGEALYEKATYILQYCTELQADYSSMARVKPPLRIGIPPMLSTVFFRNCSLPFAGSIRKLLSFWKNTALSAPAIWFRMTPWIWLWLIWSSIILINSIMRFWQMTRLFFV